MCVDFGLNDKKKVVAIAQVVQKYADCGESKYERSDTRVRDGCKLINMNQETVQDSRYVPIIAMLANFG
jgi:hypothetical protein